MFDYINYQMPQKPTNTTIALQLGRIAADLDSEKRTRANSNSELINELKGLRSDMQRSFHGDNENPGILMRLDRIERNSFEEIRKRQEEHEKVDAEREKQINQKFVDLTGQISKVSSDQSEAMAFVKGGMKVVGALVILMGIIISILQFFF